MCFISHVVVVRFCVCADCVDVRSATCDAQFAPDGARTSVLRSPLTGVRPSATSILRLPFRAVPQVLSTHETKRFILLSSFQAPRRRARHCPRYIRSHHMRALRAGARSQELRGGSPPSSSAQLPAHIDESHAVLAASPTHLLAAQPQCCTLIQPRASWPCRSLPSPPPPATPHIPSPVLSSHTPATRVSATSLSLYA